jgi:hypothetical protein
VSRSLSKRRVGSDFILNTSFFSQAFFSLLAGAASIVKLLRAASIGTRQSRQMTHPRLYKRISPSGLMSKTAQIILGPKLPALTCRVVDYSAGGACLDIHGIGAVPDRFEFFYSGVRKKSRVVWRRGIRIGVAF